MRSEISFSVFFLHITEAQKENTEKEMLLPED